jgi:hydrogenase nickel incorporation protein HypA/HybF
VHELSLAKELVRRSAELAEGRRVDVVLVRCSAAVDSEELLGVFPMAAAGTAELEGAVLELEAVPARIQCPCGFSGELDADHVVGHIVICPDCGRAAELSRGLELMGLRFAGAPTT